MAYLQASRVVHFNQPQPLLVSVKQQVKAVIWEADGHVLWRRAALALQRWVRNSVSSAGGTSTGTGSDKRARCPCPPDPVARSALAPPPHL